MDNIETEQAPKNGDSLNQISSGKFSPDHYIGELRKRFCNSLGWADPVSATAADIALDVLVNLYGGKQQYLPKRVIDRDGIKEDRQNGMTVAQISRKYGVSTRTVINLTR